MKDIILWALTAVCLGGFTLGAIPPFGDLVTPNLLLQDRTGRKRPAAQLAH